MTLCAPMTRVSDVVEVTMHPPQLLHVRNTVWLAVQPTAVASYDFPFSEQFACRHAWRVEEPVVAIARMGAAEDYAQRYRELRELGITLIHTPEEYDLTSHLPMWYPRLD